MVALGNNERERTGSDGAAVREHYVKQFLLGLILVPEVDAVDLETKTTKDKTMKPRQ